MKRFLCTLLAIILLLSFLTVGAFASSSAATTSATVLVNGQAVRFEAYNIDGNNYFKLRDLAKVLSGTEKQFEVSWDASNNAIGLTSCKAYTPIGGELTVSGKTGTQPATISSATVCLDGTKISLKAYNINDYNYFKLRDVASAINFGAGWDGNTRTIAIDTSVGYSNDTEYLTVRFLDVGQGDSEFIELPDGKTMLIDAGESEYGDTVVSYIKNLGYNKIDYLVVTHPHADHIGGMVKVVQSFAIGAVYMPNATTTTQTYANLLTAIGNAGLTITTAKAGVNIFSATGLSADIIAPAGTSYDDLNNYSAVIKLTYNNNSFLFMGDAETLSENEIVADVKADVLKVGHHGSDSSTGQSFLTKVTPKYAVIEVGIGNDYGHPTQATLDKLRGIGATIYRTDKDGPVIFKSDGTNITVNKSPSSTTPTNENGGSSEPKNTNVVISSVNKVAEIVTVKNNGTTDVNLSGWVLVSATGNQKYTFPAYTLKVGATVTVASGGASGNLIWTKSYVWNNSSSDPAKLYDAAGNLVSSYT